jgi:hypothetical protein
MIRATQRHEIRAGHDSLGFVELLTRDCVVSGSLTPGTAQLLSRMIEAKLAFLISGGTGSGKTTLRLRHY